MSGAFALFLFPTCAPAATNLITLPVIAVVTPVASLAVGNLLLGESAQLGVLSGTVAVLAVLVTSAGLVVLARLTTGQPGPGSTGGAPARRQSPRTVAEVT